MKNTVVDNVVVNVDDESLVEESYLQRIEPTIEIFEESPQKRRKPKADEIVEGKELTVNNVPSSNDLIFVPVKANGKAAIGMIDSGSACSLIKLSLVQKLGLMAKATPSKILLRDVQKHIIPSFGEISLNIQVGKSQQKASLIVVEQLPSDVLIGLPQLRAAKIAVCHGDDFLLVGDERVNFVPGGTLSSDRIVAATVVGHKTVVPGRVGRLRLRAVHKLERDVPYELHLRMRTKNGCQSRRIAVLPDRQRIVVLIGNEMSDEFVFNESTVDAMLVPVRSSKIVPLTADCEEEMYQKLVASVVVAPPAGRELPEGETEEDIWRVLNQVEIGPCSTETRQKVKDLLYKYHPLFSRSKWDIGRVNIPGFSHKIRLKEDAVPKHFPPYRIAQSERKIVEKFVRRMKGAKLIKDSKSQWALPLMLLVKPDDPSERRPVVNCKWLNQNQVLEATYLPRTEDLLDRFSCKKNCISKMDMTQFFFQVGLDPASQDICSFSTAIGNFSSLVMLQGDANAPHEAQRLLMRALEGVDDAFCLIDDIGVASESVDSHLAALEEIFKRLLALGLTMRPDKLVLLAEEVEFLGHTVRQGGELKITDEKIEAVKRWPRCKTVAEVRSFLGFVSYVRKFIRGFSQIALPLVRLTKKDVPFVWTEECEAAFQRLKEAMMKAPCLIVPDPSGGEMHLFTDASGNGLGYVLAQESKVDERKVLKPCAYGSRLFRGSEQNYSIPEKECLASVWSIKKNHPYLFGKTFRLHTDSEGVYHTLRRQSAEPLTSRLSRFAYDVMGYSFHTHHVKTDKNWADALSRLPVVKVESGELQYRQDEEVFPDPNPLPVHPDEVEIEPLWICPVVTRGQQFDLQVAPNFKREQMRDDEIRAVRERLMTKPQRQLKHKRIKFQLVNDVVYAVDSKRRRRFYVPSSLVPEILERVHSVAHLGIEKMIAELMRRYYWKKMQESVTEFVRACFTCQTCKRHHRHTVVPLKELPRPAGGQDILALDVKGPLPMSNGKRYIIVCVDMFTRLGFTRAVSHVDGKQVVDFLIEEVFPFGVPSMLITDNAKNLREGLAKRFYERMGIENRNSIPLFAQSNGGVERLIGTLASMLRCASVDDPAQWSKLVKELTTEYNQSHHRAIGSTPFELHFGYVPRKMKDLPVPEERGRNLAEPERYLEDLRRKHEKMKNSAAQGLRDYYGRLAHTHDEQKRAQAHRFQPGNWVLVKVIGIRPGESKSLGPLYHGPAEVLSVTPSSAKVRFLANGEERLRSVSHLKPFYGSKEGKKVKLFTAPDPHDVEPQGHDLVPVAGPSNTTSNTNTPSTSQNTVQLRNDENIGDSDSEAGGDAHVHFEDE